MENVNNDKHKNDAIKEINEHISDALSQWSFMMVSADADNWSCKLEYSDSDLLNALTIFNHVASNKAIKSGYLTEKNVIEKMTAYVKALEDCFGFNSIELTNKVIKK